jgi:hypothetical protein
MLRRDTPSVTFDPEAIVGRATPSFTFGQEMSQPLAGSIGRQTPSFTFDQETKGRATPTVTDNAIPIYSVALLIENALPAERMLSSPACLRQQLCPSVAGETLPIEENKELQENEAEQGEHVNIDSAPEHESEGGDSVGDAEFDAEQAVELETSSQFAFSLEEQLAQIKSEMRMSMNITDGLRAALKECRRQRDQGLTDNSNGFGMQDTSSAEDASSAEEASSAEDEEG